MEIHSTVPNPPEKLDRKTIERNRRIQMKNLIFELTSLVPPRHFKPAKEMLSQKDQIDQVALYIKQLNERVQKLKNIKKEVAKNKCMTKNGKNTIRNSAMHALKNPVVKIQEMGSSLEVILISGIMKNFALFEVIKVLEEEGVEVIGVNISTTDHNIQHILHAQVKLSRLGVDSSMVYDRLQKLFC